MRALLVAACVGLTLHAQQDRPVFRTTTRLVEFTVVALDKKDNPVSDLRKDELVVQENGKPREVSFFRFEGAETATSDPVPLPAGTFSNRVEHSPGPPRSVSAIVLDTLNTEPSQLAWVRAQVTRSLRTLAPQTRVAVYHLGTTLGVIHDFTDDLESLRQKVAGATMALPAHTTSDIDAMARDAEQLLSIFNDDPRLVELLRNQIEVEGMYNATVRQQKVSMTLAALETLGEHLAGVPGRKNLVWIGGGISMLTITGAMGFGVHGGVESREDVLTRSARRLAQQGVALYVVDARGLQVSKTLDAGNGPVVPLRAARPFEEQQLTEDVSADPLPAASLLADVTGGRVIKNTNDRTKGMTQAARDVQGSYSVGFYVNEEPDGAWHRINVKVKRPGVRLVYRQGFLAEQPSAEPVSWSLEQWRAASVNPIGSTAIALNATCKAATSGEPGMVELTVEIDPAALYFVDVGGTPTAEVEFGVAEKSVDGKVRLHSEGGSFALDAADGGRPARGGLFYTRRWTPAEDTGLIRIVVRDRRTGRQGTLDVPYRNASQVQPKSPGIG